MSEIINDINKMTTTEIVKKYTKDEIYQAFKKAQAEAGVDSSKLRTTNILYQLYMAYGNIIQYYA